MPCDNCRATADPAFTLAAHPSDADEAVVVDFCSIDCLQVWTSAGSRNFGRWRWGTHEPDRAGSTRSAAD